MTIRFVFRPSESTAPGVPGTLLCYLTVDKARVKFTTTVQLQRRQWDNKGQQLVGNSKEARLSGAVLTEIKADINRLYFDMERAGQYVTAARLLKAYRGGNAAKPPLLACWLRFLEQRKPLIGIEFKLTKYQADERRGRLLAAFLESERLEDLLPEEFTARQADAFVRWMRVRESLSNDYALKVLQTVQQVLHWCQKEELSSAYPLTGYRLKFSPAAPPVFLSSQQLQLLHQHRFASEPLRRVADCFLFQCYTGLAYVDLARFRRAEHVRLGAGGRPQLYMERQKTARTTALPAIVPLLPPALQLLRRYGDGFPVPTNQVYNRMLKEVSAAAGLTVGQGLTSHVGRKTAGALLLQAGMSMEAVSRALGHSSIAMTEKTYVSIVDSIVEKEFDRVYGGPATGTDGTAADWGMFS